MDDGSLGGEVDILIDDFETVRRIGSTCCRAHEAVGTCSTRCMHCRELQTLSVLVHHTNASVKLMSTRRAYTDWAAASLQVVTCGTARWTTSSNGHSPQPRSLLVWNRRLCLESRSELGKRPDCFTLIPWKQGRCMVWDVTCPYTLAQSHLNRGARNGNVTKERRSFEFLMQRFSVAIQRGNAACILGTLPSA